MAEITAEIFKISDNCIYTLNDLNKKILDEFSEISHSNEYREYVRSIEKLIQNKEVKGHKIKLVKEIKNNPQILLTYFCCNNCHYRDEKNWNAIKRITTVINPNLIIASIYLSMLLVLDENSQNSLPLPQSN